jgi:hypothetical protein
MSQCGCEDAISADSRAIKHELDRRKFLLKSGTGLLGFSLGGQIWPTSVSAAQKHSPRGTARFCVFIELKGGPSHVDTFDLKEGHWTPGDFTIRRLNSEIKLAETLFPKLSKKWDRCAFVRSMQNPEGEHFRAQYYLQTDHAPNIALFREIPPIGSVVAYEYDARRKDGDTFPPYVSIDLTKSIGPLASGFLPARFSVLNLDTDTGLGGIALDAAYLDVIARRWQLLQELEGRVRSDRSPRGKPFADYTALYQSAYTLLRDDRAPKAFSLTETDRKRYGASSVGDGCLIARNLIAADAGTHYIHVCHADWDHHSDIYNKEAKGANHYNKCNELDAALVSLMDDLTSTPSPRAPGKTLLDETLIVSMGEFGRTPGEINSGHGRDHFPKSYSVIFAGGGVTGGRVIGSTDATGSKIVSNGWSKPGPVRIENVAATIYSALGIDWGKMLTQTPSGRPFSYVDPFVGSDVMIDVDEISELFV